VLEVIIFHKLSSTNIGSIPHLKVPSNFHVVLGFPIFEVGHQGKEILHNIRNIEDNNFEHPAAISHH
jgi:hypothetical protein